MTDSAIVQRWTTLRSALAARRDKGATWREIAQEYPGVPPGTLCAIFKGRMPRSITTRRKLGLVLQHQRPTPRQKRLLKIMGGLWGSGKIAP